MRAKAVVAEGVRQVAVSEIDVPDPGPEDVVIRVTHSWISNGTEGSFIRGERIEGDVAIRPTDPAPFPHVPGYQKVGVVESLGSSVTGLAVGDPVVGTVSGVKGMFYPTGGHVSPAVTHQSQVWKVPEGVSPVSVSGLVLTQVGYNCAYKSPTGKPDAAIVIGDGMVGHWAAQALAYRGDRVMMVGRHDERLALFLGEPEHRALNEHTVDVLAAVREWAPAGVRVVVDTVGSMTAVRALLPVLRHGASIVSAGFLGDRGLVDIQELRLGEYTLYTPSGWSRERMDITLALVRKGVLQTEKLITHHFPVDEAPRAYELILTRSEPVLGVVLDW
jgi:2-desacetyl-2-hydroxyethyl bacteriochlorophyllide A dehydrogenase